MVDEEEQLPSKTVLEGEIVDDGTISITGKLTYLNMALLNELLYGIPSVVE